MKLSLIVCTYKRPKPLLELLNSVKIQTLYPDEIIIVDGSNDNDTNIMLRKNFFTNLIYYKVSETDRGLTKQRNYGVGKVSQSVEVVSFLDDDIVLEDNYFEEIVRTYQEKPNSIGVGGYIINESKWQFVGENYQPNIKEFYYDGWKKVEGIRFIARKILGLDSNVLPGYSPLYSHGRSVGFMPPSGKIYATELVMGGVSSFRKEVFKDIQFSTYFEGYGLYEDADFSLRLSKKGALYINTNAKLNHYHDPSGRPNQYKYGKMVVRNGWYVWRVKNPNPKLIHKIKWHFITILLLQIRLFNVFTTSKSKEAFFESLGRIIGWWSLLYNKPKIID